MRMQRSSPSKTCTYCIWDDRQGTAALENPNAVATAMLLDRRHTRGTSRLSDGVLKRLAAPEHLAEPCTENFCTRKKRLSTGETSSPLKSTADTVV
ncbi:hypothetical protein NDU88_003398 [Pleurodeles waltl]|uniref:Uncharacterized protein n=1 Tax=Pleurodeles waltl TaxID=8319 RepID=A0AAV7WSY7_PLEWA|nr:hypothetical protein NDU88_003398 [Pleurodeles waltl]